MNKGSSLTGQLKHPNSRVRLLHLYHFICRYLRKFPEDSGYRKNLELILNHRRQIIENTESHEDIENLICCGNMEQLVLQAERELNLAKKLVLYKPWEPLVVPPENQWKWPVVVE